MRHIGVLVVVAACGSKHGPVYEPPAPIAIDAAAATEPPDAPTVPTDPLASLPAVDFAPPLDPAQAGARVEVATSYLATAPERAYALLYELARCCADAAASTRWDDRWMGVWTDPTYQAIALTDFAPPAEPAADDGEPEQEEDFAEDPITCPKGTKHRGHWNDYDGEVWCEKHGKREGPYVRREEGYDEGEGVFTERGTYHDGHKEGLWRDGGTYSTGHTGNYVHDVPEGAWEITERETHAHVTYVHGVLEGAADERSYEDEAIVARKSYRHDKLHGAYQARAPEDPHEVTESGAYVDGDKHGVWRSYEGGVLVREEGYDHGVLDGRVAYWDAHGTLLGETTLAHGSGHWIEYSSGVLDEEGDLVGGDKQGAWVEGDARGAYDHGKRTTASPTASG